MVCTNLFPLIVVITDFRLSHIAVIYSCIFFSARRVANMTNSDRIILLNPKNYFLLCIHTCAVIAPATCTLPVWSADLCFSSIAMCAVRSRLYTIIYAVQHGMYAVIFFRQILLWVWRHFSTKWLLYISIYRQHSGHCSARHAGLHPLQHRIFTWAVEYGT
jgi:hypothetical protein